MKILIPDVLDERLFRAALRLAKSADYRRVPATDIRLASVPWEISKTLLERAEEELGPLVNIATFFRYNHDIVDFKPRVHSDGKIGREQPDYASVTYLESNGVGTAFFSHPIYGMSHHTGKVLSEWSIEDCKEPVDNGMLLYSADLFHCRYPFKANGDRFVIVQFLRKAYESFSDSEI